MSQTIVSAVLVSWLIGDMLEVVGFQPSVGHKLSSSEQKARLQSCERPVVAVQIELGLLEIIFDKSTN